LGGGICTNGWVDRGAQRGETLFMREARWIMGMPVTVAIRDTGAAERDIETLFQYFEGVDRRFSPYKPDSEISRLNRGEIAPGDVSDEMKEILVLADRTKKESRGYFDIRRPDGTLDPCGIVKGWAIRGAARLLAGMGHENFFVDAGGDIQAAGCNEEGGDWRVGIRSPFNDDIVKILTPGPCGVATSGTYLQGAHIYDPHRGQAADSDVVSLTVIGPDVLEADRFATAAFAMGRDGILFIERLASFEAYEIDSAGMARMTSGLARYAA
jgi:thiamine biosynthesis lipoprotein